MVGERVAALLSVDGSITGVVALDPDTRRASELARIDAEKRPEDVGAYCWAILRVTHPECASRVARSYTAHEANRLVREVRVRLEPYNAHTALVAFWAHMMSGRKGDAAAALKAFTANGLPLPIGTP
jgi:hypothetical protein